MDNIITLLSIISMAVFGAFASPTSITTTRSPTQANSLSNQNQLQPGTPFSLSNVLATSLEMAAQSCRDSFKWKRWNCPSTDFFRRRSSQKDDNVQLDREDVYVTAINTAAILYTVTKNCSSGTVAGCGCDCRSSENSAAAAHCSDNPSESEELYNQQHENKIQDVEFSQNFIDSIKRHNYKVITNLMRNSLVDQCSSFTAAENRTNCWQVLRPFNEIAEDIRVMYDKSLQLSNEGSNSQVIWKNIPLDAFVYVTDSPNFCEPEALPGWSGMRGRRCMRNSSAGAASTEERQSCLHLCRTCGYRVQTQNVLSQKVCNCRYMWGGFQVQCDTCVVVEKQHTCY